MSEGFVLITGRTSKQGKGLHQGKGAEMYRRATALVEMNLEDMHRVGIKEAQVIRVRTMSGEVKARVHSGTLPPGLLFIPLGPMASILVGADTEGTGMPLFKGLPAEVEPT